MNKRAKKAKKLQNQSLQLCPTQLKKCTNPNSLPKSSKQAGTLDVTFAQDRAIKAIKTALGIKANGYHIFAAGENGLGKRTLITRLLNEYAKTLPTPNDWVYVYNFDNPREPIAIQLAAGRATELKNQMEIIWAKAQTTLNKRFRSDNYQLQVESIKNHISSKETEAYEQIAKEGKVFNLELHFRPVDGKAVFAEVDQNHDVTVSKSNTVEIEDDKQKPNTTDKNQHIHKNKNKNNISANKNHMQTRFNKLTIALEQLEDEVNATIENLHKEIAERALKPLFSQVLTLFADNTDVVKYLMATQADMIRYVERIVNQDDDDFIVSSIAKVPIRYCVNVVASHEPESGASIVFEDLPTHLNLLGHVEQVTHIGTVTTDVSMIRAGSLHRANGGFLILEANSLLEHAYAWQGLKRALQSKQIKLSSLEQMLTLTGSLSLSPMPIDLDIKVILLGEAGLYYELIDFEPEFDAVFKIRADFHDDVKRTPESEQAIVAKIADIANDKGLLSFNNFAMASIIDHLSLVADEQKRLSLHSDRLSQLLFESNRHAKLANPNTRQVNKKHVVQALDDMEERSSYLRDLYWHEIENGQQIINTRGKAVGQINALTVISYADNEFGMPARLTVLIQPKTGHGEILDIERDVNLGGNLHAKGMLIQTSYLRSLFSQFYELNFSASLAFEQNYGHIDGDSATLAEACALMSALAEVPINQGIAITGSMNQLGEVQAIGGVNAKITGFYDTCMEHGLTGSDKENKKDGSQVQGVIIPRSNTHNLMLRDDIIKAVKKGHFSIYGVDHLHEALQILTDMPIDDKNKKGKYRKKSLFGKIAKKLEQWEESEEDSDTSNTDKDKKLSANKGKDEEIKKSTPKPTR